jgi:hypothetical protein
MKTGKLSAGDWVEVKSKEEILSTLDRDGKLDGMPFMPEMFEFCGRKMQVYKRAHKTCDTVYPIRGRWVNRTVHLETRCDGSAHGGCQASCLFFWKEAWLKPAGGGPQPADPASGTAAGCTEADVRTHAQTIDPADGKPVYSCQATCLPAATAHLDWWDLRQYVEDY